MGERSARLWDRCGSDLTDEQWAPWGTVYWYFKRWNSEGTTDRIHDALRAAVRDGP